MSTKLTIIGDGVNVDKDITFTQAGKIIAFLGSESEAQNATVDRGQLVHADLNMIEQQPNEAKQSVREMVDEASPKTHAQRIAVFGHFIAQNHPQGFFTSEEVKEQYQLAREKLTLHFSREIDKAIGAGWLEPVRGEKNTFFVTRKGENAISSAFNSANIIRTKPKTRAASSKVSAVSEDDVSERVLNIQPVVPTLNGLPNYHQLKTKGLKIMWLLTMAQANEVDRLSTKELVFFAGKLRDKLALGDISGHTQTAAKKGWVTKDSEGNYLLLHDGEEHLKSLLDEDATD